MDATVQLTEALFPWIREFAVFDLHENEFAGLGIEEGKVVLVNTLIEPFPQLAVVGDGLKSLADQRYPAQVLLHEITEDREQNFVRHFELEIVCSAHRRGRVSTRVGASGTFACR